MSQFVVKKSLLSGSLRVPPSKSQTLRAILFGSLAHGVSSISHYLPSPDTQNMIKACRNLGATIVQDDDLIKIKGVEGKINGAEDIIDAGNSGIILRFVSAVAALGSQPIVITGDDSIRNRRPMATLLEALNRLGVSAISTRENGFAPVIIKGPLRGGKTALSGEDSQPVSALLIAASLAPEPIEMTVNNPGEKPWVALTLDWLDRMGVAYERSGFEWYRTLGSAQIQGFNYQVPGDYSSAAYPIAAALVTDSELKVENLDIHDCQGDKKLIDVFKAMGAHIELGKNWIHVKRGGVLKGIEVDINDFVDAITILAVVGCFAEGTTTIKNARVARLKECDRIRCTALELSKMGARVKEKEDGLVIHQSSIAGCAVDSHQDQRMAMSLAVAGMGAKGTTVVHDVDWVRKTFPTFFEDFKALGASLEFLP